MTKTKNNLTFDVETAGEIWAPLIYDIGWVVTSPQGKILKKQRFIIKEIFETQSLIESAYYYDKVEKHYKDLKHITVEFMTMLNAFREDFEKFNIGRVLAYNLMFDIRALVNSYNRILATGKKRLAYKGNTTLDYKKSFRIIMKGDYKFLDIWGLVCETVMLKPDYQNFILDNGYVTEKGNYITNAETCYKFMFGNEYYVEEHTGLADALDEQMIYHNIDKKLIYNTQSYKTGFVGSPWQKVKQFFKVK